MPINVVVQNTTSNVNVNVPRYSSNIHITLGQSSIVPKFLTQLTDVELESITNNQILVYNSTSELWENHSVINSTYISVNTNNNNIKLELNNTVTISNSITIGNSTLNVHINSTSVLLSNSTSNINLTLPTSAQISNGQYYFNANGSWILIDESASINVAALTANNTTYVGTVTAANVVSNAQLQANLANYQTLAGLASNVIVLSSNNALYLGGVVAADYQLESGLAANVATLSANYATYILANTGIISNSTGVYVNSAYITSLSPSINTAELFSISFLLMGA